MKIEYALFNAFILIASTIGIAVYPNSRWPKVPAALYSILSIAIPFIIWDHLVTGWWWEFNSRYTLGLTIGTLPLEEILFFLVIPWSCLVIWENLKDTVSERVHFPVEYGVLTLALVWSIPALIAEKWYSLAICGMLSIVALSSLNLNQWLRQKNAIVFLGVVTFLTLIFNGYLTARPIVIYNLGLMLPFRIGTIPVEDLLYGLSLLSLVVMMYEKHNAVRNRGLNAS